MLFAFYDSGFVSVMITSSGILLILTGMTELPKPRLTTISVPPRLYTLSVYRGRKP